MARPFSELRERLLKAGVAPRHVRRYLAELSEHLADLCAEEERAGRSPKDAESVALARLGTMDELANAMIGQRKFQSWSARAPWAMFGLVPLIVLGATYLFTCIYLWCGWRLFIPGADTPFGAYHSGPIYSISNIYFQAGKYFYRWAPLLIGWSIVVVAVRQRLKAAWPALASILIAWMGATAQIRAGRTAVPRGLGHISMSFFGIGQSGTFAPGAVVYGLLILALTLLPYVVWRLRKERLVAG